MTEFQILETLAGVGAIITNSHIVYTSGRHGDSYVNKDAVYPHTDVTSRLCEAFARKFFASQIDVVVAPAIGGVILSQWTSSHLSALQGKKTYSVYAEKAAEGDQFLIRRGYEKLIPKRRVLVVEDVLTTGGSVKKVVELVRSLGGETVGVAALCNRGGIEAKDLGVPVLHALVKVDLASWDEKECPLCAKGVPVNTEVGKGLEFLSRKKN